MTVFHEIEKWLCSTKLRNDCVPPHLKMIVFRRVSVQGVKSLDGNFTCLCQVTKWLCSTTFGWKWLCFHDCVPPNDCVPWNKEIVFRQIEKWLCSTKLRKEMTVFHRIRKWLCSTKLRNDCVLPNWEMTVFHQIKKFCQITKWLCSTTIGNDCVH